MHANSTTEINITMATNKACVYVGVCMCMIANTSLVYSVFSCISSVRECLVSL